MLTYTCLGNETKTGVVRILVIFQRRPMFSHINGKLSPRPLNDMAEYTPIGFTPKTGIAFPKTGFWSLLCDGK